MLYNKMAFAGIISVFTTFALHAQDCQPVDLYEQNFASSFLSIDQFSEENQLPLQCIDESMQLMEKYVKTLRKSSKPFAYCEGGSVEATRNKTPLCRTEALEVNIQKLFINTMDCLDIPARAMFPIINVESGFFPNAVAPGGEDAGIGQITPIAAEDANSRWAWLETYLLSSTKPSCAALVPHLPAIKVLNHDHHTCQFVSAEINPLRNMVYAGFIYLINSKYFNDLFIDRDIQRRLEVLTARPMSTEQKNQIIHVLSLLSYNKGFAWMSEKFLAYVDSEEQKSNINTGELTELAREILEIEARINQSQNSADFVSLVGLRVVWKQKKMEYAAALSRRGNNQYSLNIAAFDYHNFDSGSMISFFKKMDSSRYIELAISRNQTIENTLGVGTCGEFNLKRTSAVLEYMVW